MLLISLFVLDQISYNRAKVIILRDVSLLEHFIGLKKKKERKKEKILLVDSNCIFEKDLRNT